MQLIFYWLRWAIHGMATHSAIQPSTYPANKIFCKEEKYGISFIMQSFFFVAWYMLLYEHFIRWKTAHTFIQHKYANSITNNVASIFYCYFAAWPYLA